MYSPSALCMSYAQNPRNLFVNRFPRRHKGEGENLNIEIWSILVELSILVLAVLLLFGMLSKSICRESIAVC